MKFPQRLLLIMLCIPYFVFCQKTDRRLESKINSILEGFHGQAGVYVKNLSSGKEVAICADTVFPTASMIKVSILTGIMDKIYREELQYHQELVYRDSLLYAGVDILGSFKNGEKIELSKLMLLMMSMSDNTASLWLQSLAGGGTRINQILDSLGFRVMRVNSRTAGRENAREQFGWGQTSPREMVMIIERIYKGEMIHPKISDRMLRLMSRDYWDEEAMSQIPPQVFVAGKNGAVDESRSETLLVMAPHGPYIFSIITKNQKDTTWNPGNEGWVLARNLSRLLWQYYEPHSHWDPVMPLNGKPE
jgi:beta-lactamase class A